MSFRFNLVQNPLPSSRRQLCSRFRGVGENGNKRLPNPEHTASLPDRNQADIFLCLQAKASEFTCVHSNIRIIPEGLLVPKRSQCREWKPHTSIGRGRCESGSSRSGSGELRKPFCSWEAETSRPCYRPRSVRIAYRSSGNAVDPSPYGTGSCCASSRSGGRAPRYGCTEPYTLTLDSTIS